MMTLYRLAKTATNWTLTLAALLSSAIVAATPVVTGPAGGVSLGEQVVFTVSDDQPIDGFSSSLGFYLADYLFTYDGALLEYTGAQAVHAGALIFTAPSAPADPVGSLQMQYIGDLPAADEALFTISFLALADARLAQLAVRLPDGGAYGDGTGNRVPEPKTLALVLLAGLLMQAGAARGRKRRKVPARA